MHLGQTANFLAGVVNRPQPTLTVFSRLLREGGWIRKGPRGRNAPHLTADEVASFVVAIMAAPDSPAIGLERLQHFRDLPADDDPTGSRTFGQALALVLSRMAEETADEAQTKDWSLLLAVDLSAATIRETCHDEDGEPVLVEHYFSALVSADPEKPMLEALPYFSGMGIQVSMRWPVLFRIAKAVLANEPDPLPDLIKRATGTE